MVTKIGNKERVNQASTKILNAFKSGKIGKVLATIMLDASEKHCNSYSITNRILVALAGYTDAMGYGNKAKTTGWLSVGRQVKRGEKAVWILAPIGFNVDDPKTESGKRYVIKGFRGVPVYGLEQTDIVDTTKWTKHNKDNEKSERFLETLPAREVAESWGLTVTAYKGKSGNALGWYRPGKAIALGVENLATWAHELCHAADDKAGNLKENGQHWRSETVAELGGCMLMYAMGYETDADMAGAYKYIGNYAKSAGMTAEKACINTLNRTQTAVTLILDEMDKVDSCSAVMAHRLIGS